MIDVTVKTLDSQVKQFSVADKITVKEFKERISSSVKIPADKQRLIFRGRVLNDDGDLNQNGNVHGKVLHLVEKLPQPVRTQAETTSTPASSNGNSQPSSDRENTMGGMPVFSIQRGGGGLSSNNVVQQVIQQALSGLTTSGPSVVHGTVRQTPITSGSEQRMDIRIHIGHGDQNSRSQNESRSSESSNPNLQQQTSTASAGHHHHHVHNRNAHHHVHVSEPQRQLNYANHLIDKLKNVITRLDGLDLNTENLTDKQNLKIQQESVEDMDVDGAKSQSDGASSSKEKTNKQDNVASSANKSNENDTSQINSDVPNNANSTGTSSSTNSVPIRHPPLSALHTTHIHLQELIHQLQPHWQHYLDYLEKDPPFSSTESPEYKLATNRITMVLQCQRLLGEIHRVLSMAVIPVSVTPPRVMLIQAAPGHATNRSVARERTNVATAGTFLMQPQQPSQVRRVQVPNRGQPMGMGQVRGVNVIRHVIPMSVEVGGNPFDNSNPPSSTAQRNAGLYSQQTSNRPRQPAFMPPIPNIVSSGPRTFIARNTTPVSLHRAPISTSNVPQAPTQSTRMPGEYTVNVTANVNPRININVMPYGAHPENPTGTMDVDENSQDMEVSTDTDQFSFLTNTDEQGQMQTTQLPNIPGVNPSTMQHVMQSINQTINQEIQSGNLPSEVFGIGNGENISRAGFIVQSGSNNNTDHIAEEIASVIGNTVEGVVMQQMSNLTPSIQSQSQNRNVTSTTTTTVSNFEATPSISTASVSTTAASDSPNATTTSSQETQRGPNLAVQLARELFGGHFGLVPPSTTSTSTTTRPTVIDRARASSDSNSPSDVQGLLSSLLQGTRTNINRSSPLLPPRRLVTVQSVPNCINSLARQTGYPANFGIHPNAGALMQILYYGGEFLTVDDCTSLVEGEYRQFESICKPFRECLKKVFFDGKNPTEAQLTALVEMETNEMRNTMTLQFATEISIPGVDLIESNVKFFQLSFSKLLDILFKETPTTYARNLHKIIIDSCSIFVHLNKYLFKGGAKAVTSFITRELSGALAPYMGGSNEENVLLDYFRIQLGSGFVPFAEKHYKPQSEIDKYVVKQAEKKTQESNEKETGSTSTATSKSVTKPVQSDKAGKKKADGAKKTIRSVQPDSKANVNSKDESLNKSSTKADGDWKELVPKQWVSIIKDDMKKQQDMPDQPDFSEAYASGMPASKRRKVVS